MLPPAGSVQDVRQGSALSAQSLLGFLHPRPHKFLARWYLQQPLYEAALHQYLRCLWFSLGFWGNSVRNVDHCNYSTSLQVVRSDPSVRPSVLYPRRRFFPMIQHRHRNQTDCGRFGSVVSSSLPSSALTGLKYRFSCRTTVLVVSTSLTLFFASSRKVFRAFPHILQVLDRRFCVRHGYTS